jgi:hypothetical protein
MSTGFGGREYVHETATWAGMGMLGYGGLAALRVANVQDLGLSGAALASLAGAVFGLALTWHLRHAVPGWRRCDLQLAGSQPWRRDCSHWGAYSASGSIPSARSRAASRSARCRF